jgi:hypothetical protein
VTVGPCADPAGGVPTRSIPQIGHVPVRVARSRDASGTCRPLVRQPRGLRAARALIARASPVLRSAGTDDQHGGDRQEEQVEHGRVVPADR